MPSDPRAVDPATRPTRRTLLAAAAALVAPPRPTTEGFFELGMRLAHPRRDAETVILTFDACPGRFDPRVASALIEARIPATVFVSVPWMRANRDALALLLAHPDVFNLQNHGARHLACILQSGSVWGVQPAGDLEGVRAEVDGGARALVEATGKAPTWFRGAAALYSPSALGLIERMGVAAAGFSLSGDGGATFSTAQAAARVASARNGDVVIAHINQPLRPSGAGVAEGVMALKARGVRFLRLDALTRAGVVYEPRPAAA